MSDNNNGNNNKQVAVAVDIEVPNYPAPAPRKSTGFALRAGGSFTALNIQDAFGNNPSKPPQLMDIISNTRMSPFSRSDFRGFLVKRSIEELLDYYLNVFAFKAKFNKKTTNDESENKEKEIKNLQQEAYIVTKCLNSNTLEPVEIGKAIANEFIREGCAKEVNISFDQRMQIMKKLFPDEFKDDKNKLIGNANEASNEGTNTVSGDGDAISVFDPSFNEVESLIQMNAFNEFVKVASTMNISKPESYTRLLLVIRLMIASAIILAVIIWAEFDGRLQTRWVRLVIFPLVFYAAANFEAYRIRVCIICAYYNVSISTMDCKLADAQKNGTVLQLLDMFARHGIQSKARWIYLRVAIATLLMLGIALAIPPYNNV